MLNRKRKGFTLAELLIVVAIIVVLTAIAVPLFVSGINKANDAVVEANKRAVRGAAVVYILEQAQTTPSTKITAKDQHSGVWTSTGDSEANYKWELKGPWWATAHISKSGDITSIEISLTKVEEAYTDSGTEIVCTIKVTELSYTTK